MQAKFTQGNILKHIAVMTFSGAAGLIALFMVDLVDTFFLSLLGEVAILAALGYAGSILFFTVSLSIGLSIGCGAMVARLAGRGDRPLTQRFVTHAFVIILIISSVTAAGLWVFIAPALELLGASAEAYVHAKQYLRILLPSMPLLAIAMACGGIMRAFGEAKNAMFLPLVGALVNAILDPIFIFALDWGMPGAAAASVLARVAMLGYGLKIVLVDHRLLGHWQPQQMAEDAKQFFTIALPATLTNLSTPIGVAFVTAIMAQYGDDAVGGNAIAARIQQVSFAGLFALSGAIGPIAAQNWGVGYHQRVQETLTRSLQFVAAYCFLVCSLLAVLCPWLIKAFNAEAQTADLIRWTCYGFSLMFVFNGATFVTNALFNNLGVAHRATQFNVAKTTLGTMPFAYFGGQWAGPFGVLAGVTLGAALVACAGVAVAYHRVKTLEPA